MATIHYFENCPKKAAITYRRLKKNGIPVIYYGGRNSVISWPAEYDSQASVIVGWD